MTIATTIAAYAGAIIAVGGAAEVLRRLFLGLRRFIRGITGAIIRVQEMHAVVVHNLVPNGGGALIDKVNQIHDRVCRLEEAQQDDEAAAS
jgi:hypothetical protein